MSADLINPTKALLFRIVHIANVPWILTHGLHCRNSGDDDPNSVNIGLADLIDRRSRRIVPIPPGGTLSDYVPFYFTPWSIMLYKVVTGHGIAARDRREIVFFVSSVTRLVQQGRTLLFTDQHAYPSDTRYFNDPADIAQLDWPLLASRDFHIDPEDPGKQSRYQAEALIHQRVPLDALHGLACYDKETEEILTAQVRDSGCHLPIAIRRNWYF